MTFEQQQQIDRCHVCDSRGQTASGRKCDHSEATARAARGAALARANIRPTVTPESRIAEET